MNSVEVARASEDWRRADAGSARLLVLACGNESRGDDALGPTFCARASALPDPAGVTTTFVADFQLQPEHAFDLEGQDLVLFVDASRESIPGYAFRPVEPARPATFTTHGFAPAAVLDAYRITFAQAPPPAFVLAIRGERFDLGAPLGPQARHALDAALGFFALLRRRPSAAAWRAVAEDRLAAR